VSFIYLFLWWLIATSLGIAAIVALEPLWRDRAVEARQPVVPKSRQMPGSRHRSTR
jgi:hypothetical protein